MKPSSSSVPAPAIPAAPHWFLSDAFWIKIIIIAQLFLYGMQFTPELSTNGDDAHYYIVAKSLAQGTGYRNVHMVSAPKETQYPVGFPLFLAATYLVWKTPILPLICMAIFGALITLLTYAVLRSRLPRGPTMAIVAFTAFSWIIADSCMVVLSEVPYLLSSLLAIFLLDKSIKNPKNIPLFIATIVVSILPLECRSIGMAFGVAWIISTLLQKQWKYAIGHLVLWVICSMAFRAYVGATSPYILQLLQKNSYDPELGLVSAVELITRLFDNFKLYATVLIGRCMLPGTDKLPAAVQAGISLTFVATIAIGWIRSLCIPRTRIIGIYLFCYFGILMLWQVQWSSERFVVSVVPFLFFLVTLGLYTIVKSVVAGGFKTKTALAKLLCDRDETVPVKYSGVIIWSVAVISILLSLGYQQKQIEKGRYLSADWINYYSCADWIRTNTPPDAVVINRKPDLFYLRSNHIGMNYTYTRDVEKSLAEMRRLKTSYVVMDNFFWTGTTGKYLYPVVTAHPECFKIVYALKNPDTYVLEFMCK